jgi:folylpolyglutamate synthase/dihydropteroate synthase
MSEAPKVEADHVDTSLGHDWHKLQAASHRAVDLAQPIEDPAEALTHARGLGEPVLVTGSLYLLADLAKDESLRWRTLATG